jgi:hypothetical protein
VVHADTDVRAIDRAGVVTANNNNNTLTNNAMCSHFVCIIVIGSDEPSIHFHDLFDDEVGSVTCEVYEELIALRNTRGRKHLFVCSADTIQMMIHQHFDGLPQWRTNQ